METTALMAFNGETLMAISIEPDALEQLRATPQGNSHSVGGLLDEGHPVWLGDALGWLVPGDVITTDGHMRTVDLDVSRGTECAADQLPTHWIRFQIGDRIVKQCAVVHPKQLTQNMKAEAASLL